MHLEILFLFQNKTQYPGAALLFPHSYNKIKLFVSKHEVLHKKQNKLKHTFYYHNDQYRF